MGYRIAAFAALALFYGVYIGKMLLQKRAGIRTDQMGRGKAGREQRIEIIMKCATYLTVAVEVGSILANTAPLPPALRVLGALLAFCGDGFFMAAVFTMRDSWRAGVSPAEKTDLVTRGVFQISRNPAFLGFDLVYAGIALLFCNPVLLASSLFAGGMLHLQIACCEEPFLRTAFGQSYLDYEKRVCRYLGRKRT